MIYECDEFAGRVRQFFSHTHRTISDTTNIIISGAERNVEFGKIPFNNRILYPPRQRNNYKTLQARGKKRANLHKKTKCRLEIYNTRAEQS